jgi:hypothetical protein
LFPSCMVYGVIVLDNNVQYGRMEGGEDKVRSKIKNNNTRDRIGQQCPIRSNGGVLTHNNFFISKHKQIYLQYI